MTTRRHILLINPWIYDFAAYNLWIEPVGLLTVAGALRENGYSVQVIDCLASHQGAPRAHPYGCGKLRKTLLEKPQPIAFVPRRFGRYGLPVDVFDAALASAPTPAAVMVTSGMTYWYSGVAEVIRRVRRRWGQVPVVLGGVYASLCPEHARAHSGADHVAVGAGVVPALHAADSLTGSDSEADRYADPRMWPAPAHDLVPRSYAVLASSWGCPYRCTYCASYRLQPQFIRREPRSVVDEILTCARLGIQDFAFCDDALTVDAESHLVPVLEAALAHGLRVRFHTPNGIHAGGVTADLAALMRRTGFATIRLSLETTDSERQRLTGGKVSAELFALAAERLKTAGFGPRELGAYLLVGLPDQPLSELEASIRFVHGQAIPVKLALFSPIPGTQDGDAVLAPGADPLLHNNTVQPYLRGAGYVDELQRLQLVALRGNEALQGK